MIYDIVMISSSSGSVITLTATMTKNGQPLSGVPINFYRCALDKSHVGINLTVLSTVVSDITGKAIYNDVTTIPGMYHHVSEYSAL